MQLHKLLLSPGFANDQTIFATDGSPRLWRSTDAGQSWTALDGLTRDLPPGDSYISLSDVGLSPEFDQDNTLAAIRYRDGHPPELYLSQDRGDSWQRSSELPPGTLHLVIAPLFAKWQTLFGYSGDTLYRSMDGGRSWQTVFSPESGFIQQFAYAPNLEANRPLFLLVSRRENIAAWGPTYEAVVQSRLYRSTDGGQTWRELELPAGLTPSALAVSPNFAKDGLLFLGTSDGRVVTLRVDQ
jgi:photosystem II stability/assembly factor-like uncharacterized protein